MLTFLDSLLPGSRNVRPPLLSGLLWAVFFWLLLTDDIPDDLSRGHGLGRQIHSVASYIGPIGTLIIGALLIFITGALATSGTTLITRSIGGLISAGRQQWQWQRFARSRRRALKREEVRYVDGLSNLDGRQNLTDEQRAAQLASLQRNLDDTRGKLAIVAPSAKRARLRKVILINNKVNRAALGSAPPRTTREAEESLVERAWRRSVVQQIIADGIPADVRDVENLSDQSDRYEIAGELSNELAQDPLDILRSRDEKLFLELDRARSEREVRIAIALPLSAISILASIRYTDWALIGLLMSAAMLVIALSESGQERIRVINILSVTALETPATISAENAGRYDAKAYERRAEQRAERAREAQRRAEQRAKGSG